LERGKQRDKNHESQTINQPKTITNEYTLKEMPGYRDAVVGLAHAWNGFELLVGSTD
jgi:hypothetical protein